MSGVALSTCCMKAGRPMRAADRAGWHRSRRHSAEAAHTRSGSCCAAVQTSNRASAVRVHHLTPTVYHFVEASYFIIASSHMLPVHAAARMLLLVMPIPFRQTLKATRRRPACCMLRLPPCLPAVLGCARLSAQRSLLVHRFSRVFTA